MRLFWKGGYASTSTRELLKSMEIGSGSFYNALKCKKHVYLESLKLFSATIGQQREEALLTPPSAALGIRALFHCVLESLEDPETPSRMCLMSGSISRDVLADDDLRSYIEAQMAELGEVMAARLTTDKEAGLLPAAFEPQGVATIIVTYLHGLFRMALLSYDRNRLEREIDLLLKGLGL